MRYGLSILFIIIVAIAATVFLVNIGGSIKNTDIARVTTLADFGTKPTLAVSWTQQGHLVGDDARRAIRVTVTPQRRTIDILAGYDMRVERSADYENTPAAYDAFVLALDHAKFGKERKVAEPDERGVCPLGFRFIYRFTDTGNEVMRTWSDSCVASDGPFDGNSASLIGTVFRAQITGYGQFTKDVIL